MLSLVLAVATALVWGTADFSGGKASQRSPAVTVSVLSKLAAVPLLVVAVAVTGGHPTVAGLAWGALAGAFGMAGVILLYRGLATGAMSVVAPVTAVTAALVPFLLGIVLDGVPKPSAAVGAVCAVAAIALVSAGGGDPGEHPGERAGGGDPGGSGGRRVGTATARRASVRTGVVWLALAAGFGFGLFMTFLSRANEHGRPGSGLWPLTTAQLSALLVGLVLLRRSGGPLRVGAVAARWIVVAGLLDFTANILYLLATRTGALSVVAPVASLYPASTVLLALAVDRERVRPLQLAGLGLAAVALVLVGT